MRCTVVAGRWAITVWLATASLGPLAAQVPFTEEAAARGLGVSWGGYSGRGIALEDLDGDGDLDLLTTGRIDARLGIYENDGSGQFTDRSPGTPIYPFQSGLALADYDGDGDIDIHIARHDAANLLLRNDGDFAFTDVTAASGLGDPNISTGCAWGDVDGDGWLDLYVVVHDALLVETNRLFRNLGDGTFEDVTDLYGVGDGAPGFQSLFLDYDRDGDVDLYLANDKGPSLGTTNRLWRNDGGVLLDVGTASGAGVSIEAMGIGHGDFDGNGLPDFYVTDTVFGGDNVLLLQQAGGTFVNEAASYGVEATSDGWAACGMDYDNDGRLDLYVADSGGDNRLYHGAPAPPWEDFAAVLGVAGTGTSFCATPGDIDGDGDLDLLVQSLSWPLELFINHEGETRSWLEVRLQSSTPNTHGVGATVEVTVGADVQFRQITGGGSYKDSVPQRAYFGLGDATQVDVLTVHWPGGAVSTLEGVDVDQVVIVDDAGAATPEALFIRGEVNGDGSVDLADGVALLAALFQDTLPTAGAEPCPVSWDANADDHLDVADPVYIFSAVLGAGPTPPAPFPSCGVAPESALSCEGSFSCD